MSNITRIKNNQITDNTIEYQKIKSGTLVGTNFNANLTLNSNVTILGNLTVANSFAQLNSINTYINDPVVVFNNNYTGSPTYDIGMLINRNLDSLAPYGAVNAAFVWKESDTAFEALMTSETGTTAGSINNSGWANVKAGNTTIVSGNVTEAFNVVGASTFNTIEVTNLSTFNGNTIHNNTVYITDTTDSTNSGDGALVVAGGLGVGGSLNVYGNITTATGNIITTSAGIFYGTDIEGHGAIYAGTPSGYTILPNVIAQFASNVNSYSQINFQNINSGPLASADFVATADNGDDTHNYIDVGINSSTFNNPDYTAYGPLDGYLLADGGNLLLNAESSGKAIKFIVGGYNSSDLAGKFNPPQTVSASPSTGTFLVYGGAGIEDVLQVGGNIVAASGTASSSTTTGALVVAGGVGISGAINANSATIPVVNATAGNVITLVATNFSSGNIRVSGGYISALANATITNTTTTTAVTTNFSTGNAQITGGSITGLVQLAGQYVTATTGFSTGNAVITGGSINNTPIGASTRNTGAFTTLAANGITSITNATASTTSANGALVVTGGTGIGGNLNVGGSVVITGDLTVQGDVTTINTATLDVEDLNITVAKGAASAAAANGGGLTVDGASATLLYTSATDSWNINKQLIGLGASLSNTTASSSTTTGALVVAGGVGIGGSIYGGTADFKAINNTPIGNATPSTASFTVLNATTGFSTGNAVITGGSTTGMTSGSFTTLQGTNFSTGNAQITGGSSYIGTGVSLVNSVYGTTGYFTNISTGNVDVNGGTINGVTDLTGITVQATNFSSGNIRVSGGYISALANATITNTTTTTAVTTNFSTGNAVITGGSTTGMTSGSFTTLQGTNFSTGNAVITGGSINNTPIGSTTAAPGRFTTITATGVVTSAGNLVANSGTASTSVTSGALVITGTGGLGVGGNVFLNNAVTINASKTAGQDFIVKGDNDETLIWARPSATYDQVLIGNSATTSTLVHGAKLIINSSDSMILPVGTNAQRPSNAGGTDTQGMFRYNTTVSALEIYDGAEWDQITTQFTVIVSEQFTGDDTTLIFNMSGSSTTAASIVSINGVIQLPTLAYSVSGTTLTFTEAPADGDIIDVRRLATTSIVQGIASTNGYMQVQTDNSGVYIYTGSDGTASTTSWNTAGAEVSSISNVSVASANTTTTIDTFDKTVYRSAKYTVQVTHSSGYQISEVLVIHDGTTATRTMYATMDTNANLGVTATTISGGNVLLQYIASNTNTIVRVKKEYMVI